MGSESEFQPASAAPLRATACRGLPGGALRETLWERYVTWLDAGIPSDRILALVESPTRTTWSARLKGEPPEHIDPLLRPSAAMAPREPQGPMAGQRVFTPAAWIEAELVRWWPRLESRLVAMGLPALRPAATPLVLRIDLAQYLIEHFSEDLRAPSGTLLDQARSPRAMQNVQILDALARAVEHGASLTAQGEESAPERLAGEVVARLMAGSEPAAHGLLAEARVVLTRYLDGMLAHRLLDHALALDLYTAVLWPDPDYRRDFTGRVTHVLLEHLDELSLRLQRFVVDLVEAGVSVYTTLQADRSEGAPFIGGLREHLGADPAGAQQLADRMEPESAPVTAPPFLDLARGLHDALHDGMPRAILRPEGLSIRLDHLTYQDMLDAVVPQLLALRDRHSPSELALVVPALDPLIIWSIRHRLERADIPLYVFAGTNRLMDYRSARLLLSLAKLMHPTWDGAPTTFEWVELAEHLTGLNPMRLAKLAPQLFPDGKPAPVERLRELVPDLTVGAHDRYARALDWIDARVAAPPDDLALALRDAFAEVYAPSLLSRTGRNPDERAQREISHVGQLVDLATRFQDVERRLSPDDPAWGKRFLGFLAGNPIAERPFFKREPHRDALMLSTANQLAERGFRGSGEHLRHLFLLDVGSERWWKPDRKELTNPRVLSYRWHGGPFGPGDGRRFADEKLARVLYQCCLLPTDGLHLHASLSDAEGRENLGELPGLVEALVGRRPRVAP